MFEESLRENKNHFLNPRNVMVTVLLQPAAFMTPLSGLEAQSSVWKGNCDHNSSDYQRSKIT